MQTSSTVAVYFVASPLQYLAARQIAQRHEAGARQVLVWYQPGVAGVVQPGDWDASAYMPWPRWHPLPGPFGRLRRLRANIRQVAALVGPCDTLHVHSAVFDTEAINYFLRALPRACGARTLKARILPDGVINVRRYPLSGVKRMLMRLRHLRTLAAPELRYTCFAGDRIGSDAAFCDRIYVLPGLPHEYPCSKVVTLQPLVHESQPTEHAEHAPTGRALVIGQPLTGTGLLDAQALPVVNSRMRAWLAERGIQQVVYRRHPKDPDSELSMEGDEMARLDEPLESWMAGQHFDAVVGVRSTALLFARQVYGPTTEVRAFGWRQVHFKSPDEKHAMADAFRAVGVALDEA
jgi:hypothetical protein